jgi:hypothetical protein
MAHSRKEQERAGKTPLVQLLGKTFTTNNTDFMISKARNAFAMF